MVIKVKIKVRVFLDNKQIQPEKLMIKNSNIDRIVNDVIDRNVVVDKNIQKNVS